MKIVTPRKRRVSRNTSAEQKFYDNLSHASQEACE